MEARRLAIAFGSRGKGRALAHYEPARVVINLTKMKGAGSLAHEWGHAFDDWLGIKCGVRGLSTFLSASCTHRLIRESKYPEVVGAMRNVVETMKVKQITPEEVKGAVREQMEKVKVDVMGILLVVKNNNEKIIQEVLNKLGADALKVTEKLQQCKEKNTEFDELMQQFEDIQFRVTQLEGLANEHREACKVFEVSPSYGTMLDFKGVIDKLIEWLPSDERDMYRGKMFSYELARRVRDYDRLRHELDRLETSETYLESKCKIKSDYYTAAVKLDQNRREAYYSDTVEMFARAFESYIESSLAEQGLKSEYLVHSTMSNAVYGDYAPYPLGDERIKIGLAIKNLINIAYQTFKGTTDPGVNYGIYKDKKNWASYRSNVKLVKVTKRHNPSTPTSTPAPETIEGLQGLRNKVVEIGASDAYTRVPVSAMMNKFASGAKQKLGYTAVGVGNLKNYKVKGLGNSKSFAYINFKSGRAIMLDDNAKPEKQLEGLIEAIVRDAVYKGYGETTAASMLAEGVTYTLCKQYNLDVRTYCLSGDFEALSKNTSQSKSYLNICMRIYKELANTVFNLGV